MDGDGLRIGEFARRVGVSPELLRAWERRYGLLRPVRSPGGFRLYTAADADRVARMRRGLDGGLSAAEAARAALDDDLPAARGLDASIERLLTAIRDYDEPALHAALDEALAAFAFETVLRHMLFPALQRVGVEWERGNLTISQEHFASNVIRGRLMSMARLWGRGSGPLALLACITGEEHDISLLAFGLLLRSHGWRILFLGADAPVSTIADTAARTRPVLTILASFNEVLLASEAGALRRLAEVTPLALCGPGASASLCRRLRIRHLDGDPVSAAGTVAAEAAL